MRALTLRLILPLLILLVLEFAFRAGVWEPLTPKNSNAGKAARVTRGLSNWPGSIGFVTIGDSRAKHGLDHQSIADTAKRYGYTHAKLTIPGAHILTETLLIEWLKSGHPDLQGGIIATSVSDLLYTNNGDYELGIAQPLSKIFQREEILLKRFKPDRPSTWGAVSSLYQYREDIQDFVQDPAKRLSGLYNEGYSDESQLFASAPAVPDVCRMDWTDLASCVSYSGKNAHDKHVAGLCARWLSRVGSNPNVDRFVRDPLLPGQQATFDSWLAQFQSIDWPKPPVVVLMPVSHLWYQELAPDGADEWTYRILGPLNEAGKIHLLDYSHFFDTETGSRCDAFSDPYHLSQLGMKELTADLLPSIEAWLYEPGGS